MNPFAGLFRSLARTVDSRRRSVLCTIVGAHGSTPQSAGATLIVRDDMSTEGTLGGGCVEAEVRRQAYELLHRDESALLSFKLDHDYGWDDGLICGGTMRVAVVPIRGPADAQPYIDAADRLERGESAFVALRVSNGGRPEDYHLHIEAPARLLIAGAGHVGAVVARLAVDLDFDVTVIDDRSEFANATRLPPPIRSVVGDIQKVLSETPIDPASYIVIVTRGHNHDEQALHAVIDRPARYIGMIGSRRKVKLIFDDLAALGVSREKLERVRAPIGLPIGAVTVPEIGISIISQLVEERRKDKPTRVEGPIQAAAAEASA